MRIGAIIFVFVISISAPASAFDTSELAQRGSLYLDDLMPLIEKAPKLKNEVIEAVSKIEKKPEDILCIGQRFPGAWEYLAGKRVAPYFCRIGDQALEIGAKVRLTGKNGKVFESYTRTAMKNAQNISQTKLTWKWTAETPSQKK